MQLGKFVIARRALSAGIGASAFFLVLFLLSQGRRPEMAHGSLLGVMLLVALTIPGSVVVGIFLDLTWPKTTSRWHGAGLGFVAGCLIEIIIYYVFMPWHFGVGGIVACACIAGIVLGAPTGAIWWTPPPERRREPSSAGHR